MPKINRKCVLCKATCDESKGITLHRFPKSSIAHNIRAETWAKFCFPDKDWSSPEFQDQMNAQHIMLCSKHFKSTCFVENKLSRNAVPTEEVGRHEQENVEKLVDEKHLEAQTSKLFQEDKNNTDGPQAPTRLEICIDSLESAINAIHGGADELEVCSSLSEGGLTPTVGLVKQIKEMVSNIEAGKQIRKSCRACGCDKLTKAPKVNVMIRCRTGSDFHYSEEEMDTMLSDVDVFKDIGVDRFVFGALTDTQQIDKNSCLEFMQAACPVPLTFHRAFDVCTDSTAAVEKLIELGFSRLMTSGQRASANEDEAINLIQLLMKQFGSNIEIMPGAGINLHNAKTWVDMGCTIVHSSCKRIQFLPKVKNSLSMGTSDSEHIYVCDENTVHRMKLLLNHRYK